MKRIIIIALMIVLAIPVLSWAMDATLQWDANTEPDLDGYKVYYDINSGGPYNGTGATLQDGTLVNSPINMSFAQDENEDPDIVEFTIYNLPDGVNQFLAVKALDSQGLESDYSNEVNTDGEFPVAPGIRIKGIVITQTQTQTIMIGK